MSVLILTDAQKVRLSVGFTNPVGNPAPVDGVPQWTVSDENIIDLQVAADGLSAEAITKGPLGTAQVTVTADADMGEGTRSITGTLDLEVRASEAVAVGITAGTPETRV